MSNKGEKLEFSSSSESAGGESEVEAWVAKQVLADSLGIDPKTAERLADLHREEHLEWFEHRESTNQRKIEYYHPDLVGCVQAEYLKYDNAPEGWMTRNAVTKHMDRTNNEPVKRLAEIYREEHPEWFQTYRHQAGLYEHYHPELVGIIKGKLGGLREAPEGWATQTNLSERVGRGLRFVKEAAESFREEQPEWFGEFKDKGGAGESIIIPN